MSKKILDYMGNNNKNEVVPNKKHFRLLRTVDFLIKFPCSFNLEIKSEECRHNIMTINSSE